jgi:hypothetical protein
VKLPPKIAILSDKPAQIVDMGQDLHIPVSRPAQDSPARCLATLLLHATLALPAVMVALIGIKHPVAVAIHRIEHGLVTPHELLARDPVIAVGIHATHTA